jgi:hypothetical protein
VWHERGGEGAILLYVLNVEGETVLVRTIPIGRQPPATLRRTMAAALRGVVEAGLPERTSSAEEASAPTSSPDHTVPSVPRERSRSASLGLGALYGLRVGQDPGPAHHALGLALWATFIDWIIVEVRGRLGLPADLDAAHGGRAWHAAAQAGLGVGHDIRMLSVGGLVGVDLEWLWGTAETGRANDIRNFDHLSVGIFVRAFLQIRLWRGIVLLSSVETAIRPQRRVYLMHGAEVVSSGHAEIGISAGLGWRFF